jgi:hypothetical protein
MLQAPGIGCLVISGRSRAERRYRTREHAAAVSTVPRGPVLLQSAVPLKNLKFNPAQPAARSRRLGQIHITWCTILHIYRTGGKSRAQPVSGRLRAVGFLMTLGRLHALPRIVCAIV